jgi:hypothetical protein
VCGHVAEKLNIPGWGKEEEDVKKLVQLYPQQKECRRVVSYM